MEVYEGLEHSGVKGMKWGVRKKRPVSSDAESADAVKRKVKEGGIQSLTNKEMQTLVNRINLEQQYKRLNPGKVQQGAQIVADILRIGGTVNQVVSFARSPAGKAVADLLKSRG